jgi:hypothetical protein
MRKYFVSVAVIVGMVSVLGYADVFSIDASSPSVVNVNQSDLLAAGPNVHVSYLNIGLQAGDELDALSAGSDIVTGNDIIYFSVDRNSLGVQGPAYPYDVTGQAALGQQAGDIFVTMNQNLVQSAPQGTNYFDINQHELGLVPSGLGGFPDQQYSGAIDNLDAYSMEEFDYNSDGVPDVPVYFSLASGSPTLAALGASGADILVWDPATGSISVKYSAAALGLNPDDDIDALALNVGNVGTGAYFSLANRQPADVFYSSLAGTNTVAYAAGQLGLVDSDNVDALETNAVPEPVTLSLFGFIGLALLRRKK